VIAQTPAVLSTRRVNTSFECERSRGSSARGPRSRRRVRRAGVERREGEREDGRGIEGRERERERDRRTDGREKESRARGSWGACPSSEGPGHVPSQARCMFCNLIMDLLVPVLAPLRLF